MAQIFQCDAQFTSVLQHILVATPTNVLTTRPLPVPYQTAKAKVHASFLAEPGALATAISATLIRNVLQENLVLATWNFTFPAATGVITGSLDATDEIPDPRDVEYTLQLAPTADAADVDQSYIEAMLLSG
jgi:hypothetical protein